MPINKILLKKLKTLAVISASGGLVFGSLGIWTGNEQFFSQFLVPILNRVDPEVTHRIAVHVAKYHLTRAERIPNTSNLATTIPISVTNPVGIAAGFDKNAECISGLMRMGFGFVEVGSVTPVPQEGNPKPRVFRLPEDFAVINRYGFNNDGVQVVHERVTDFKRLHPEFPVGVNLGANKDSSDRVQDYCQGIRVFSDVADYFVINVSSPNTPNLRTLQNSESLPNLLDSVLATRDREPKSVPIFLKVAPDLSDDEIESVCNTIRSRKVDGVIVSNTTVSRDHLSTEGSLRNEVGGLSGKPLTAMSTEMIRKFYKKLPGHIKIIGVGGIWSGQDAYDKICAGASAVQIYSVMTYRGPRVVSRIKSELASIIKENGFDSVAQAVGSTSQK